MNAQYPSGEMAFSMLMNSFGWAKHPLVNRMHTLDPNIPVTMIYGEQSFMDKEAGLTVMNYLESECNFHILPKCGHHIYIDNAEEFNYIVTQSCDRYG